MPSFMLKEKIVIKQGDGFSECLILYSVDGKTMCQRVILNSELSDDAQLELCKMWIERRLTTERWLK